MKTYYTNLKKKGSIREADLKNNEIFVVYVEREDMYYRVQVIEMSLEQVFMFFKNCKSFVIWRYAHCYRRGIGSLLIIFQA